MTHEDEEKEELSRDIEEKLEILRKRAAVPQEFVDSPEQPPLLWQMAMLAQAGWTVLPRVDKPNPEECYPEMTVEMRELWFSYMDCVQLENCSANHWNRQGVFGRSQSMSDFIVRFETRHMFCVGSCAEQLVRERAVQRL